MQDWQKDLWATLSGLPSDKKIIITTPRAHGKSILSSMNIDVFVQEFYKLSIIDQAVVDGENWYTVSCRGDIASWFLEQEKSLWFEHKTPNQYWYKRTFDIKENLLVMAQLKWN